MHADQRTASFTILIAGLNMCRSNTPNDWPMLDWTHPSAVSVTHMTMPLPKR